MDLIDLAITVATALAVLGTTLCARGEYTIRTARTAYDRLAGYDIEMTGIAILLLDFTAFTGATIAHATGWL